MRWTLLAAAAVAALSLAGTPAAPQMRLADGDLELQDSREGEEVFSAENVAPGEATSGTVALLNTGSIPGELALSQSEPEASGAALAQQLQLVIQDVTSTPATVYSGSLAGLTPTALGTLAPGTSRTYSFTASLPASADNSVADASMTVDYTWTVSEVVAPPPPPPPPPSGGSNPTTPFKAPLRLRVRVPARQPVAQRGWLIAYVRCDQACTLEGRAHISGLRTAPVRVRHVRAGREVRLVLRLSKRARLRLRRARVAPRSVRVTVVGRTGAGARKSVEKRARIAIAKSRR